MPEPLTRPRRVAYALGAAGFQFTERIVVNVAIYFYLPPAGRDLVPQVSQKIWLGGLTAFGVAMLVGRIFDALADPFVGHASDRSRSRWGRRRTFLMFGAVPMVGLPVLVFWPPGPPGSTANTLWLTGCLALYFVAFTVYVAPYLALIPELAWSQRERVRLASLLALAGFPVLGLYSAAWGLGLDWGRAAGLSSTESVRVVVVASSIVALVLCLLPILAVDERRHVRATRSDLSLGQALGRTLANRPFLMYLAAQLLFVLGINLIQPSLIYYATVVLGRSEGYAATLGLALVVATLAGFPVVSRGAQRWGPKRAMVGCVILFSLAVAALGLLVPDAPGGVHDARNLRLALGVMIACGIPVAGFLVLPHVLISQLIDYDEQQTGANRAAMYFGVQGFLTKWMYGVSGAVLALLFARFGNSSAEPLGVLLIGPIAGGACLLSAGLFALYPERSVLARSRAAAAHPPSAPRPAPARQLD